MRHGRAFVWTAVVISLAFPVTLFWFSDSPGIFQLLFLAMFAFFKGAGCADAEGNKDLKIIAEVFSHPGQHRAANAIVAVGDVAFPCIMFLSNHGIIGTLSVMLLAIYWAYFVPIYYRDVFKRLQVAADNEGLTPETAPVDVAF